MCRIRRARAAFELSFWRGVRNAAGLTNAESGMKPRRTAAVNGECGNPVPKRKGGIAEKIIPRFLNGVRRAAARRVSSSKAVGW
eukprot:scaffold7100_cov43-Phaeocystis_antarctica.AAC.1